jgi:chromate reductase
MSDVTITGIVGSLRTGSVHASLARAATASMPEGSTLTIHDVGDLALYNGDHDGEATPAIVRQLRDAIRRSDGLVFFSPEYNSSLPAVTKNVIDWMSRDASAWGHVIVTMATLTPGGRAGRGVREHFERIMDHQAPTLFPTIGFGRYGERLGDDGKLTDPDTIAELTEFLVRFVDACR